MGAIVFSLLPSDRTRHNRHKFKHKELHLNMRRDFFKHGRTLELSAQRSDGACTSGDIANLPGLAPLRPSFGEPALAGGLYSVMSRGPFQLMPFYDSMIQDD